MVHGPGRKRAVRAHGGRVLSRRPTKTHAGRRGPRWSPRGPRPARSPPRRAAAARSSRPNSRSGESRARPEPTRRASRSRNAYSVSTHVSPGSGSHDPVEVAHRRARRRRRCRRDRCPARRSPRCGRARTPRRRPDGSARRPSPSPAPGRPRWSCSPRRRGRRPRRSVRPRRIVRMSPRWCSHSGLSRRDTSSISPERSTSVMAKRVLGARRCGRRRCRAPAPRARGSTPTRARGGERGLLRVVFRGRDQRPPRREVSVEAVFARAVRASRRSSLILARRGPAVV